jgi:hypothetical protein
MPAANRLVTSLLVELLLERCGRIAQQRRFAAKSLQGQEHNGSAEGREGEAFSHGEAAYFSYVSVRAAGLYRPVVMAVR